MPACVGLRAACEVATHTGTHLVHSLLQAAALAAAARGSLPRRGRRLLLRAAAARGRLPLAQALQVGLQLVVQVCSGGKEEQGTCVGV